ncbi:hypothetical protein DD238_002875 [Peronospora effusa]|uniref:Protein kinase domain-containing protein n=1 Tax=Peronospora effusa TaxID=542832 RepID=A0A3M6VM88_9STRA|nr:hypothetical protein DD238_002875 [Peronospora effusa]RQM09869.1 hypothetical protein DD237_002098 [Peronospora effusa]
MKALPTTHNVLAFLHTIYGLCQQMRDRPRVSFQAHARLHQTFVTIINTVKEQESSSIPVTRHLQRFMIVLHQLKAILDQHLKRRNLVAKVTASRRLLSALARIHSDVNGLLRETSVTSATSALLEWKQQFAVNRFQDEEALHETLMALLSTPTFVNKEFPSERCQALVLLELVAEFASNESLRGHSSQLLETLKMTHRRISNLCDLHLRRVPRWFLPGCEVDYSPSDHTIGCSRGSFGSTLQRGEAYRYSYKSQGALSSTTSTVAVKCLWALPDIQYHFVEQLFARSGVYNWTRVRHPNVVTVRGASHVASPPYLVRDFTTYGGLTSYLAALETRAKECAGPESIGRVETLTWQLLYGASRGLLHLHEQQSIVHGGLRCNNILVDKKGRAVIADFGLYTLACNARDSGLTEYFHLDVFDADAEELIRWQAPECLREHVAYRESLRTLSDSESELVSSGASASATSFSTDVYAFGMCILEALTRTVPWAGLDIAKIRTLKENLSLLPPRPRCISSQGWTLIEKMCAADPKKRLTLREASQELKRLGYWNRESNHSRNASCKDSDTSRADATAKVECVSSARGEVSPKHIDENRSRDSSVADLKALDDAKADHVSTSRDEVLREHNNIPDRCRDKSALDLNELEEQATQKLTGVSSVCVNNASQELKRLGVGEKVTSESRDSSALNLVTVTKDAFARLIPLSSDGSGTLTAEPRQETLSSEPDKGQNELFMSSKATSGYLPPIIVDTVDQLTASTADKQICKHSAHSSALSDASTVELTGRPIKNYVSPRKRLYSNRPKASSGVAVGSSLEKEPSKILHFYGQEGKAKVPHCREVVRSLHGALLQAADDSDATNDKLDRSDCRPIIMDNNAEITSVTDVIRNWPTSEQPEQEMDSDTGSVKSLVSDEEYPMLSSSAEEDVHLEELATGDSLADEEALMIVPAEFQTARSFDEDDSASPLHPMIGLLDILRTEHPEEALLVETLEAMKEGLELSTAWMIVEREGFLTFMKLVWIDYSEACTIHALEILQSIADLSSDFVTALVESKLVKILLAVVKHRSSPLQVDLAASFLLEIIAENDEAKIQLWNCRGVGVMEDSVVINRRLVQEVKSTMAKFKRNEGLECLENGECHLAIDKFTEAIALDRKRAGYYGDRSLAYMEASMYKKAADDAYRCMRYNPYDVTGYLRHGLALKALGKYKEAIQSLRKGTEVDPKFVKIRDTLIATDKLYKARLKGGSSATMLRHMTAAESAKLKKKDGDDALRKKDYALAVECYSEALELDPKNDWVYLHRSIAHTARRNYTNAIEDASKCIRINYRQVEGYYRLALALYAANQHDQALNTLYRGQEVDPRHAGITRFINQLEVEEAKKAGLPVSEWFKEKGYRAFQLRSYEDAIQFYTKAIDASQSDDDEVVMHCYLYRSRANQTRGEFLAVIADCTYVLERCPKNVCARLRRADAYEQQRDLLLALEDIRELVTLNPEYEDAHARLESLEHRCRLLPGASERKNFEIDSMR